MDPAALRRVALQAAGELAAGTLKPEKRKPTLMSRVLEGNPIGRAVLFSQALKAIEKAAGGHYPAPLAILETVQEGVENGMAAGERRGVLIKSLYMCACVLLLSQLHNDRSAPSSSSWALYQQA